MDYLFLVCELAAAFAGFTAIIAVLHPDSGARAGEFALNKVRLRQMLEVSLFTIAAGLLPALIVSMGVSQDTALRIAGGLCAVGGIVLLKIQGGRGFRREVRELPGFNIGFARFIVVLGNLTLISYALAAAGVPTPTGWYLLGTTMALSVAAMQFLRTATTVLRVSTAPAADVQPEADPVAGPADAMTALSGAHEGG